MQAKVVPIEVLSGQSLGALAESEHLAARCQRLVEWQMESLHGDNLAPGKLHT